MPIGTVLATKGAIIPSAVGVDIGCGMVAVETTLEARHLPDSLKGVRSSIERAVPHGRTNNGRKGDRGAWRHAPDRTSNAWADLERGFASIVSKHKKVAKGATF